MCKLMFNGKILMLRSLVWPRGGPYHAPSSAMKTLAWNCSSLGNAMIVRTLWGLICKISPDLVFLVETKKDALYIE